MFNDVVLRLNRSPTKPEGNEKKKKEKEGFEGRILRSDDVVLNVALFLIHSIPQGSSYIYTFLIKTV